MAVNEGYVKTYEDLEMDYRDAKNVSSSQKSYGYEEALDITGLLCVLPWPFSQIILSQTIIVHGRTGNFIKIKIKSPLVWR